ncbi:MupA/Atu3671 family FMN-dependent luciferase-like monooxygenase [Roseovarius salis]|uniref:MupA/Atu3671 family FMN-dependent luciferase-like monooxygenase n=1 Tax=Roseovarius salis TaxID=3376063 RepID=UPI0037C70A0A
MTKVSAVLIGEETLLVGCGDQMLERGHAIAAVISGNARVREWAEGRGLPCHTELDALHAVASGQGFDWLLSIANLRMLPDDVLALPEKGAVNFHDGPLPRYAGLNTPVWALLAGEATHGVSWHVMEAGADRGDILATRQIPVDAEETAHSLNSKCYAAGLESFAELLPQLETGDLRRAPQDFSQRMYFGANSRPEAGGYIDFARSAADIARLVRALDFSGYRNPLGLPRLFTGENTFFVRKARLLDAEAAEGARPGQILELTSGGLHVAAGSGAVALSDIVDMAGRPVDLRAVLQPGGMLPTMTAAMAARLTQSAERLARHESFWRARLERLEPANVPLADPAKGAAEWYARRITLPGGMGPAVSKTVIGLWAAQGEQRQGLDIAHVTASAPERPEPRMAAPWVPLRVDAKPGETLADAVAALDAQMTRAADHAGFAADLGLRDPAVSELRVPAVAVSCEDRVAVEGVCVHAVLGTDGSCTLHFDRARLDDAAIDLLTARLTAMFDRVAAVAPEQLAVEDLMAVPESERQILLDAWNRTEAEYDPALTIHHAFEVQAARTPQATALVYEDSALSYGEVNARANAAAAALRRAGVGRGVNVGLCVERSPDLVIGALAILKAGGAYVPLDPDHPSERLGHVLSDSGARVVLAHRPTADHLPRTGARVMIIEDTQQEAQGDVPNVDGGSRPDDLAYLIYTSGSTGKPKGVMVEHRNVANFFRGMDDCVDREAGNVWLAVTSISFDISALELFYTLARGFKVVISGGETRAAVSGAAMAVSDQPMDFSIYFWGNDDGPGRQKYQLLLDGARFADEHGFVAVWTPERHFHAFGGPYPNPSVSGAAVAAVTRNISVRAGSIVAPLHHPARIAEDWAVIDNLTEGRAGLAFASGWHPDDFVLRPENTPPANKPALFEALGQVRRLWRGEAVEFETAAGKMLPVTTLPRPVSDELETWVTTAGNPQTWREAGENGAHILTHLLGQSIEEVGDKIRLYHDALRGAGHDPADFKVTVMLHSYIAEDRETAREVARGPMREYLRSAAGLLKQYAWAFPAFKRPEGVTNPFEMDLGTLGEDELEAILDFAFERYFEDAGLFGTVADGVARAEQLKRIGVTEIACLIDYGIAPELVLEGLKPLADVLRASNTATAPAEDDFSLAAQIVRHDVTHLQCTPSMARLLITNDEARTALRQVRQLLIGGEALPAALVDELHAASRASITNMYGPTETTVWSTAHRLTGRPRGHTARIGRPIANTRVYVLDESGALVPTGNSGELCIGGDGVTRGYWQREELTAERYVPDPFGPEGARVYRTGDIVRWTVDGELEYLGRRDHQVKIRGQRIELGEIEDCLKSHAAVADAVVVPRQAGAGDVRLAGYYTVSGAVSEADVRAHLASELPEAMVPPDLVKLESIPLTPNKKVDRNALPAPGRAKPAATSETRPETSGTERRIAEIWAGILGLPDIGAEDNFFDLGGHSLLAVQAHRDLRKAFADRSLSITDIFRYPVLRDLARHLDGAEQDAGQTRPQPGEKADAQARASTISKRRAMRAGRERQAS